MARMPHATVITSESEYPCLRIVLYSVISVYYVILVYNNYCYEFNVVHATMHAGWLRMHAVYTDAIFILFGASLIKPRIQDGKFSVPMYVCGCVYVAIRRPHIHHACAMRKALHQCFVTLNNAYQTNQPWPTKKSVHSNNWDEIVISNGGE